MNDDPQAPVFFLSYARPRRVAAPMSTPAQDHEHVARLFKDLTSNLNQLIALDAGCEPGFVDLTMDGGQLWEKQLIQAAGTCQVFIALLSPPYVTREWCAMEWDIFSRRKVVPRSGLAASVETAIVPVLWTPIHNELPPAISAVNRFAPQDLPSAAIGAQYESGGLLGLMKYSKNDDAYELMAYKLALHVQRLHAFYWVEPSDLVSADGLQRSFSKGGARR